MHLSIPTPERWQLYNDLLFAVVCFLEDLFNIKWPAVLCITSKTGGEPTSYASKRNRQRLILRLYIAAKIVAKSNNSNITVQDTAETFKKP